MARTRRKRGSMEKPSKTAVHSVHPVRGDGRFDWRMARAEFDCRGVAVGYAFGRMAYALACCSSD